jgi:hypothetical protein
MATDHKKPTDEALQFSSSGVDLSLIRWSLALSPLERLYQLQNHVQSIMKIRNANPKI